MRTNKVSEKVNGATIHRANSLQNVELSICTIFVYVAKSISGSFGGG
jgi:hypothetical protein